ncbi:MAG: tRNA (N6-threonylcarbamoyladenosine(37)-N6)-methyltransferase TrmO [Anaerolineae bacterium]
MSGQAITLHPIGRVERDAEDVGLSHDELQSRPARILLDPALSVGLLGLEPGDDILVLYYLHRSSGYDLRVHPRGDPSRPLRGVFATRSPRRPNPIGVTTARVRRIKGHVLEVVGLDALDGSPVLDIKVYASSFDCPYTGQFVQALPLGYKAWHGRESRNTQHAIHSASLTSCSLCWQSPSSAVSSASTTPAARAYGSMKHSASGWPGSRWGTCWTGSPVLISTRRSTTCCSTSGWPSSVMAKSPCERSPPCSAR